MTLNNTQILLGIPKTTNDPAKKVLPHIDQDFSMKRKHIIDHAYYPNHCKYRVNIALEIKDHQQ